MYPRMSKHTFTCAIFLINRKAQLSHVTHVDSCQINMRKMVVRWVKFSHVGGDSQVTAVDAAEWIISQRGTSTDSSHRLCSC